MTERARTERAPEAAQSARRRDAAEQVRGSQAVALQAAAGNRALGELLCADGAGERLDEGLRSEAEAAFGGGLDDVRLHQGPDAHAAAALLDARAFALGQDIWLGAGASMHDRTLLGHELAHVVQQRGATPASTVPVGEPGSSVEHEAAAAGRAFGSGDAVGALSPAPPAVQRAPGERSLEQLLKDPAVKARLLGKAAEKGSEFGGVLGQATEEVMYERIRTQMATPEGRAELLGKGAKDAEFIEGYRIRDASGAQLSDGMVLEGKGKVRELLVEAEAKAGKTAAEGFTQRIERDPSASAIAERQAELVKGGAGKAKLLEAESGGQFASVRERLKVDPRVRIYSPDLKTFQEVEVRVTPRTRWLAGAPQHVPLEPTTSYFGQNPLKLDVRPMQLPVTQQRLFDVEEQVLAEVGKKSIRPPAQASFEFMKPPKSPQLEFYFNRFRTAQPGTPLLPPTTAAPQMSMAKPPPEQLELFAPKQLELPFGAKAPPAGTGVAPAAVQAAETAAVPTVTGAARALGIARGVAGALVRMAVWAAIGFALEYLKQQAEQERFRKRMEEAGPQMEAALDGLAPKVAALQSSAAGATVWANLTIWTKSTMTEMWGYGQGAITETFDDAGFQGADVGLEYVSDKSEVPGTRVTFTGGELGGVVTPFRTLVRFSIPIPYDPSGMSLEEVRRRIARNEQDASKGLPQPVMEILFLERNALLARMRELQ